jgi:hypothetical protein
MQERYFKETVPMTQHRESHPVTEADYIPFEGPSIALRKRIARLEADLLECREFLEGYVDVVDGDYGEPSPNRAMRLVTQIDETLNGRPY